jgi:hypothetical protein
MRPVIHGCSSGVSLNDASQMAVHTRLAAPSAVMPCAKPRSRTGCHHVNARVAVGNAPPSPMPTSTRQTTSEATLQDRPVSVVAPAHSRLNATRTRRGPNRRPPAGDLHRGVRICEGREDQPELDRRRPEILPHRGTRHRDVHAIDVGDEVHQAQDKQNEMPDPQHRSPCVPRHVRSGCRRSPAPCSLASAPPDRGSVDSGMPVVP